MCTRNSNNICLRRDAWPAKGLVGVANAFRFNAVHTLRNNNVDNSREAFFHRNPEKVNPSLVFPSSRSSVSLVCGIPFFIVKTNSCSVCCTISKYVEFKRSRDFSVSPCDCCIGALALFRPSGRSKWWMFLQGEGHSQRRDEL